MFDKELLILTTNILLEKIKKQTKFNNEDYKATEIVLEKFMKNLLIDEYKKFKKELIDNECKKRK